MKGVWIGELERFGYMLRVISKTEEEAFIALSDEYKKTYKTRNGSKPDTQTFASAVRDMSISFVKFNEVEWT